MIKTQHNVREVIRDIKRLVSEGVPAAGLYGLRATAKRIQKRMQVPGKPVTYPINWDSVRQMIAYFASNGFGEGIPYRRKGRYEEGWQVRGIPNGVELGNRERSARFIGGLPSGNDLSPGKKQSSIHKGRHRLLRPVVDEEVKQLPQDVIDRLRIEASK
jgi:hypothetical protein